MNPLRTPPFILTVLFLATLASVPLVQTGLELGRHEMPQALEVFRQKPTSQNLRGYERSLEEASWAAAWLRPWAQYAQFAWLGDGGAKALVGREGWLFYKPGVDYLVERPGLRKGSSTAEEAVTAILDFRDQLAAWGVRLLVIPAPNKESIYPEKLTRRAAGLQSVLSADTRAVLAQLKGAGVEVFDLFELFGQAKVAAASTAPPLYLAQDSHWSPAGVELAAKAVAKRLLERGWVGSGPVDYRVQPAPVQRVGDVLRMLQVPQLERQAAPETAACRKVVRHDDGQPYRDEPSAPVLVLGDSFLRIYEQDDPQAAGFIAHLARELKQPVTSIVNDGGASTLVRQELARRPAWLAGKKLVVWEFVERDIRLGTEGWQVVPLPRTITDRTNASTASMALAH
jgi:hypothetical protein